MSTHVERFRARPVPTKVWIGIGAAIVLLAAIAGGTLIGRATVEEPAPAVPESLAVPTVVQTVDAHIAALNAGDRAAIAAFYSTPYAGLTGSDGTEFVGARRIAGALTREKKFIPPVRGLERVSAVLQFGDLTVYAFTSDRAGPGLMVLRLDINRRIVHQAIMGDQLSRSLALEASES